jgi:hypothetical protein
MTLDLYLPFHSKATRECDVMDLCNCRKGNLDVLQILDTRQMNSMGLDA